MPGFYFDDGSCISICYADDTDPVEDENRTRYQYFIDTSEGREYEQDNLQSGVGRHNLFYGFEALIDSLRFAAYDYESGEESSFEGWVPEWAYQHLLELDMLLCTICESERLIVED